MLTLITVSLLGLLGALIGSFANVVIYRVPRGESIAFPGSHCPNCARPLTFLDLVPIASWLALRGRCRGCKEGIALRYPLVEAITALGFVLIALRWPIDQYGLTAFVLAALYAMLVMMSAIDIDEYILPDSLTLPAIAVGLLGSFFLRDAGRPAEFSSGALRRRTRRGHHRAHQPTRGSRVAPFYRHERALMAYRFGPSERGVCRRRVRWLARRSCFRRYLSNRQHLATRRTLRLVRTSRVRTLGAGTRRG